MKSKTVKMVSAVAVLGVLSGTYVGVKSYVSSQEEKEAEEADQSVSILDIDSDNVSSVSFQSDDGEEVVLEKEEDSWIKKDETEFPLSQDTVDSAVDGISVLTADQKLDQAEDLSEYDLDEPENEITLTVDDGDETVIQVGMKNESTDQYYVKKSDDNETIYLVPAASIDPFMNSIYDFAEAETFPSVTSNTITNVKVDKEDGYELSQDSETLSWNVSDGSVSEKADTSEAGTVTSAIGSLMYGDFVDYNCTDDSEYGFDDPYAVITVKYTEEEEADTESTSEDDTESGSADEEASEEVASEDSSSEETADEETESASEDSADEETSEDAESEEEELETITVDKELIIYVGDQTDDSRYVKVNDSSRVYTITEDSLTDILDKTIEDFYDLTVNYLSVNNLENLKVEDGDGTHTIDVIRENSEDEDGEETTTYSYELDGEELEETAFTSFYNKINNMIAQERLTEEYDPEEDPVYVFTFTDTDGDKTIVEYYEYDTNFYAAVVDDKVYLVNKMNVRDLEESYQEMIGVNTEETSSESDKAEVSEAESSESDDTEE